MRNSLIGNFGRRLLLAALLATAGCWSSQTTSTQPLAPATKDFQPFFFVLAGDPQIGGWSGIAETKDRFVKLAGIANDLQPAFVLMAGDLVNNGPHEEQLAAFDDGLSQFAVPTHLLCGNHDDLATYRRKYGRDYYTFTYNNCEFICINSNFIAHLTPSAAESKEADAQWSFLESALADAVKQGRAHIFVAMHHPPLILPLWAQKHLNGLLNKYGVEVVLCGHLHRTMEFVHKGYVAYAVAGTGWAGDKKGYGYRIFKVYADRIEQEYITLDATLDKAAMKLPASQPSTK